MCGIAGLIYRDQRRVRLETLNRMTQALRHRGPDDQGVWSQDTVGFAHTRLSVIDLKGGHQPMTNHDHQLTVTYNGEIYNFKQLKILLQKMGWQFQTSGDTEVLLALWHFKGPEMVHDLEGMFAFAIHDSKKQQVFLATDRFGQKPLYYTTHPQLFAFASEPNALKTIEDLSWSIDPASVHHYLSFLCVSPPRTIYREMNRLAGGRRILYDLRQHNLKEDLWYHLNTSQKSQLTYPEAQEKLRHLLKEAVKKRLISDVPLGAFLSGGIDSTIVVGLAQEINQNPLQTFTISTDQKLWDESQSAHKTAQHLNTVHHCQPVNPCDADLFLSLISHLGEPFADSSLLPTALVCQTARQQVTVALSGDGADEAFGGYNRYRVMEWGVTYDQIPQKMRQSLARFLVKIIPSAAEDRHVFHQAQRFFKAMQQDGLRRYFSMLSQFDEDEKLNLYSDNFFSKIASFDSLSILEPDFARSQATTLVEQMMDLDVHRYLQDDILTKVDRASMLHSLEVRSPFLDQAVMEFAFSLPLKFKREAGTRKKILRDSFRELFPPPNLKEPKKGFAVPLGQWFRGPLKTLAQDLLTDSVAKQRDYFDPQAIDQLLKEHEQHKNDHGQKIWALCVWEAFCRSKR